MGSHQLKIGILSSSRADYSIYRPLIAELIKVGHQVEIIAFGTHMSEKHGLTYKQIEAEGFDVPHQIKCLPQGDQPKDIAEAMGENMKQFAAFWSSNTFDLVFALGDRFEMFAAVSASLPFNIKVAHIHGGEMTTGAIDNAFRHSISHMASYHFAVAEAYHNRLEALLDQPIDIYNVGSLSLDNYSQVKHLSVSEMKVKWNIDFDLPTILMTVHPETVSFEKMDEHMAELTQAMDQLNHYHFVITMPNNDTFGNKVRAVWNHYAETHQNVTLIESFGTVGYLSAMQHCSFLMGNTSSGFVEASMYPKHVINLGNRQDGRIITPNIYNTAFKAVDILKQVKYIEEHPTLDAITIYGKGKSAQQIASILPQLDLKSQ